MIRSVSLGSSLFVLLVLPCSAAAQSLFNDAVSLPNSYFTNFIALVDLDGDDDLDIIAPNCSGFMSTGPQPLEVYRNGGAGTFVDYAFPLSAAKPVRQVALGDIEADGDIDVYIPDASTGPHFLFVNNGSGVFADESGTRLPGGFTSRAGATEFGDVDGDGDLDLFVGDAYAGSGTTVGHILVNDGDGVFTMGAATPAGMGDDPIDVDFADVDRDWDLDIMLNMHVGKSLLWLNDGSGNYTDATANVHAMEGFHYGPSLCDIDGDADLDLWTDNAGAGLLDTLATNDGMGVFTDMSATLLGGSGVNPNADDNGVICVDIDHDNDLDGAVISLSTAERVLENDGGTFSYTAGLFPASANDNSLWLDFGDLNNDGRLDAVTGQGEPAAPNKVFLANTTMPVDAMAPRIIAVEQVSALTAAATPVLHYAVSDGVVSEMGPRLQQAFVTVTTDMDVQVDASYAGGDLYRAVLPANAEGVMVTYVACAVDLRGNQGCSQPQSYTVGESPSGAGGGGGMGAGGATSTGAGASTSGAGGAGADDDGDDDGGCGCKLPGRTNHNAWLLLALPVAALWRRRR
jgi:hypothetical protein